MKWFKHYTDARRSEGLSVIRARFGFEGIGWWFTILEMIAEKMDESDRCYIELPVREWCLILQTKPQKLRTYLDVLVQKCRTSVSEFENMGVCYISVEVHNLLKNRDEHTRKLRSKSGESHSQRKKVEGDIDKENTNTEKVGGGRKTQPTNGHHPELLENPITGTRTEAVIEILHRIGHRTGIREYQEISALSWLPDLRKRGIELGYQCLLNQALRFEQHMLAKHEAGDLAKAKSHHPRAKFMNTWLSKVYDNEKTSGDRDELIQTKDFDL